jgi:pantetheine-phosphate adenylyltransferase
VTAVARLAVYAGSFDPVTLGHVDLIERASALFSDVVVALGVHPTRHPLFSVDERLGLLGDREGAGAEGDERSSEAVASEV